MQIYLKRECLNCAGILGGDVIHDKARWRPSAQAFYNPNMDYSMFLMEDLDPDSAHRRPQPAAIRQGMNVDLYGGPCMRGISTGYNTLLRTPYSTVGIVESDSTACK